MGSSVEVNSNNYDAEVVVKSYEKPVLVDFSATWCGPCQMLKPVLEKLVQEYDFVLAKVDIDENPDLASSFGVEGVPDVRIVTQGEMIPGFVGALSEPQLRDLLRRLNLKSDLEAGLEAAQKAVARGDHPQAKHIFDQLFANYPHNHQVTLEAAKFLVKLNQLDSASTLLATIGLDDQEYYRQAQGVKALIQFRKEANNLGESELDQLFAQASRLVIQENYEQALQSFLAIVERDRRYRDDGARRAMLSVFDILGKDHLLTQKYQSELMLTLY